MSQIAQVFKSDRRRFVLFEVGLLIVLTMLFMYILTAVTITSRTLIVSTEDLMNSTIRIHALRDDVYEYRMRDIATLYNGRLYISVPNIQFMYSIQIVLPITYQQLIEKGFNYYELYIETDAKAVAYEGVNGAFVESGNLTLAVSPLHIYALRNNTLSVSMRVDPLAFAASIYIYSIRLNENVSLYLSAPHIHEITYIVIDIDMYAVSEKPVFKALMEPIFSAFAALYAVFLAMVRRVKEYVLSAFGGFVGHFTLTGLIGDPVIALILVVVFVTIVFIVIRKRR